MRGEDATDSAIAHAKLAYSVGAEPETQRSFDDEWAPTYDQDFVGAGGDICPTEVARVFLTPSTPQDTPVVDVGCERGWWESPWPRAA